MCSRPAIAVLHGLPGAGKGTVTNSIRERFPQISILSCGDLIRIEAKKSSSVGSSIRQALKCGQLVPDELVSTLVFSEVAVLLRNKSTFTLLDGYPRTPPQALALEQFCSKHAIEFFGVLSIDVPLEVARRRLHGRRTCAFCGAIYNVHSRPPQQEGICDNDRTPLSGRAEESDVVIELRLRNYNEAYKALSTFYALNGFRVYDIDGTQSSDAVAGSVLATLPTTSPERSSS